jgi:hypothetical protein
MPDVSVVPLVLHLQPIFPAMGKAPLGAIKHQQPITNTRSFPFVPTLQTRIKNGLIACVELRSHFLSPYSL